ncbi:MAG: sensor histidine kinase [Bacteroidota bacterium]
MHTKPLKAAERNLDSALIYFRIAERIAREDKNYPLLIEIHKETCIVGVKQNPPDLQLASRNIDSLNSIFGRIKHTLNDSDRVENKIKVLEAKLLYHKSTGDKDSIGHYLSRVLNASKGVNFQMQRIYLTEMAQYKRDIGQLDSAYIYLDSSMKVTVKYFDLRSREEIGDLLQDNALQEKEARIAQQETRLQFNRFFLITALIVGSILGVSLLILYRSYRARTRMNASLKKSEQEKTTLLQELHHRVKNNLQMLNTLLMLQSRKLSDPTAKAAVMESRARVETMSLAHRKLYDDKALSNVNLQEYLHELITSLTSTYLPEDARVNVKVDKRWCSADFAIPIGLIINELVTNSIKYATPEDERLAIIVEIRQPALDRLQMIYQDNGPGMPLTDHSQSNSLGLRLIELMTAQLKGEFSQEGPRWRFDFTLHANT